MLHAHNHYTVLYRAVRNVNDFQIFPVPDLVPDPVPDPVPVQKPQKKNKAVKAARHSPTKSPGQVVKKSCASFLVIESPTKSPVAK